MRLTTITMRSDKSKVENHSRAPMRLIRLLGWLTPFAVLAFLVAYYGLDVSIEAGSRMLAGSEDSDRAPEQDTPPGRKLLPTVGSHEVRVNLVKVNTFIKMSNISRTNDAGLATENRNITIAVAHHPSQASDLSKVQIDTVANSGHASFQSFAAALAGRASTNKDIILSLMDMATFPMAVNFWETSLKPYNIDNYLFISSNAEACQMLLDLDIPCFLYMKDKAGDKKSIYMSKDFIRKMNIRTYMILEALLLGYNVLHTDIDEIWFKNPFDDFTCDDKCDVAALWDCGAMNAGFVYVRHTKLGIQVYKHMNKTAATTSLDDQTAFNKALGAVKKKGLRLLRLPDAKYQCGMRHWEQEHRTFAGDNPCKTCVVAHNNWIVSLEAKTYRFREMHYWMFDENQYYSSKDAKYLIYDNVHDKDPKQTKSIELNAFRNALAIGQILNRIVILPKFHCGDAKKRKACDIINLIKIRELDKIFPRKYREHTFLGHPKVPSEIKNSVTKKHIIRSKLQHDLLGDVFSRDLGVFSPKSPENGASGQEIADKFGNVEASVLSFHSLYGAMNFISDPLLGEHFIEKLNKACTAGKYRQF